MDEKLAELLRIIKSDGNEQEIRDALEHYHDSDIAEVLTMLTESERNKLYRILGDQSTSDIFTYLENVEDYIEELDNEKAADIIELMDADDAIDVLNELEEEDKKEIIGLLEPEAREDIGIIASYGEDEIGSMMTTNFITVPRSATIKQAMKHLVDEAPENDNIYVIYALNDDGTFHGTIDLKSLIMARSMENLEDIIKTSYPFVFAKEKISECINELKDYSLDLIPVLDARRQVIGVITMADIMELVHEEISDDYAKFAGLTEEEDLREPISKSLKKRLPWLGLLLVLGMVISLLISQFDFVLVAVPALVFFQSAVFDMAGNVGTQSLAVTIRVLMDEENSRKKIRKLILKETRVGFLNGLIIGTAGFIGVFLILFLSKRVITEQDTGFVLGNALMASAAVSAALVTAMTVSSFVGTVVPIVFKKIKIDPAVASGPLITTLNDITAVVVYYGVAALLFTVTL